MRGLLAWFEAGKIAPHVDAAYPFDKAAEALRDLEERRVKGKVVLVP